MAGTDIRSTRTCTKCLVEKPATREHFCPDRRVRDGCKAVCKPCSVAYNKEWQRRDYQRDPKKRLEANRRWIEANAEKYRAQQRARAKRRGSRAEAHRDWSERNREHVRKCKAAAERKRRARKRQCIGHHSPVQIEDLLRRQNGRCFYCRDDLDRYHVDHFVPLARGGSNDVHNLRVACPPCNRSKGAKMPWEWRPDMFEEMPLGKSA